MIRAAVLAAFCLPLVGCAPRSTPSPAIAPESEAPAVPNPAATKPALAPPAAKERQAPTEAEKPSTPYSEASSPEKEGIHLTVRVPKVVPAGSPLPVQVKITNNGKIDIFMHWDTTNPIQVHIAVMTKDGKKVPFTVYGKKTFEPTNRDDILMASEGSIRTIEVKSGKTQDLSVSNVAWLYDLTVPGEYFLTVSRSTQVGERPKEKIVRLQVEKIPFTISWP